MCLFQSQLKITRSYVFYLYIQEKIAHVLVKQNNTVHISFVMDWFEIFRTIFQPVTFIITK